MIDEEKRNARGYKIVNEEKLIEDGGKLWEKGNIRRIYLTDTSIVNYFGFKLVGRGEDKYVDQFRSIGKAKVWYDCNTVTMKSDEGRIRVLFNRNEIECH